VATKGLGSTITYVWLDNQFKEVKRLQAVTTEKVNKLQKTVEDLSVNGSPDGSVTAELETQIKRIFALATRIDRKVPDQKKK
jgi:hypothetical protein